MTHTVGIDLQKTFAATKDSVDILIRHLQRGKKGVHSPELTTALTRLAYQHPENEQFIGLYIHELGVNADPYILEEARQAQPHNTKITDAIEAAEKERIRQKSIRQRFGFGAFPWHEYNL